MKGSLFVLFLLYFSCSASLFSMYDLDALAPKNFFDIESKILREANQESSALVISVYYSCYLTALLARSRDYIYSAEYMINLNILEKYKAVFKNAQYNAEYSYAKLYQSIMCHPVLASHQKVTHFFLEVAPKIMPREDIPECFLKRAEQ